MQIDGRLSDARKFHMKAFADCGDDEIAAKRENAGKSALMRVCAGPRHAAGARRGSKKRMNMKRLEAMETGPEYARCSEDVFREVFRPVS